jgi:carbamoyl-phosphate synthase large subunit
MPIRLGLLTSADAMLIVRTGPSESAAFEIAYNVFGGPRVPMFFALWWHAPAHATMLRELDQVESAESAVFVRADELRAKLEAFLERAAEESRQRERRMIRMMERLVA